MGTAIKQAYVKRWSIHFKDGPGAYENRTKIINSFLDFLNGEEIEYTFPGPCFLGYKTPNGEIVMPTEAKEVKRLSFGEIGKGLPHDQLRVVLKNGDEYYLRADDCSAKEELMFLDAINHGKLHDERLLYYSDAMVYRGYI